jgi:uncharacterized protein YyaL (SSP411 family)
MHEGEAKPNRLITEKSPYLLQHASNPVDWFPWGDEAFEKARREGKPIFLSVGYSTCHWCHVMERESFTDPDIARALNKDFVSIKVDREERPDVDRVYMTFVQASTGGGGWPMSVWLTPDLKPFFGGTYFPPDDAAGRPGFKRVLTHISGLWETQREKVLEQSERMLAALAEDARVPAGAQEPAIADLRTRAFGHFRDAFDGENGGFGRAPKFPRPATLEFLFDVHASSSDAVQRGESLRMALETLRHMAAGGIHDLVGGGFHRYSVDAKWRVPHFEKMLYDQAQLAGAYLAASQLSDDPVFAAAARDTLEYVQREMTDPAGGFHSAEDADSAIPSNPAMHGEGAFYVWTAAETDEILGERDAAVFNFACGVLPDGNVEDDWRGEFAGRNILYGARTASECGLALGMAEDAARSIVEAATLRLREVRGRRPRPLRDDKVIAAWNGLMISAFARAAQILGDRGYASSAERAAAFLRERLFDPDTGRLARSYRAGVFDDRGFAADYAFLIQGLLDLYETVFDVRWLDWAARLQEKQIGLFWDAADGGFFESEDGDPSVLLRMKEEDDGAEPSANSVSVRNLVRLSQLLGREDWRTLARRTALAFGRQLERAPTALPQMLVSLGWIDGSPRQIIIAGEPDSADARAMVAAVWGQFLPRRVLARIDRASRGYFASKVPFVAGLPADSGDAATAYVCEDFVCRLPLRDPAELAKAL